MSPVCFPRTSLLAQFAQAAGGAALGFMVSDLVDRVVRKKKRGLFVRCGGGAVPTPVIYWAHVLTERWRLAQKAQDLSSQVGRLNFRLDQISDLVTQVSAKGE